MLRQETNWSKNLVWRLRLLGEVFANALIRVRKDRELQNAFQEIRELKERLENENVQLRGELEHVLGNPEIIGSTAVMQRLSRQLEKVAETDTTVLLLGETGTGKGLIARSVYSRSRRRERPLIIVNCAALPAPLVESELFGHEKGAFTGAMSCKIGRFELADGGTLLLDEIGDLPLDLQAKLLRILQESEFERIGSTKTRKVDVRVIAATNRDLKKLVHEGMFRADLYYRLNVFPITIPPLRIRRDDIPLLVWYFVQKLQRGFGKRFKTISRQDMKALKVYDWPGNVRELSNVIERTLILSSEPRLEFGDILTHRHIAIGAPGAVGPPASSARLEDVEREHIIRVLEQCGWRVRGAGGAAKRLGLKGSTLQSRIKKLRIQRPGK
jgi:transcriptional regulator with GAF, ATPase, and Fis domain